MTKKYLLDPFNAVYQDNNLLSDRPKIKELDQYARDLESQIEGDFNLEYLTFEFAYNQLGFVRNGLLLAKIKFLKLYQNYGDGTFASFCKFQLKKQRWQINDTIRAARVVLELMYAGFEILPTNISQAVTQAQLAGEDLSLTWRNIITTLPPDRITAKTISNVVNPSTESEKEVVALKVPTEVNQQIETEAFSRNLSVVEFLKLILEFFLESENSHLSQPVVNKEEYKEKERIWQEDLIKLCKQGDYLSSFIRSTDNAGTAGVPNKVSFVKKF
ncbi:hypothetical protein [Hyella patelloides]|nr:hypothetical protein [Hyella patelloides]